MAAPQGLGNDAPMFRPNPNSAFVFSGSACRRSTGFTLVELMVTVAIIGVLVAIAIPQYKQYLIAANRSAAKAVLMDIVSRQEQYILQNRGYFYTCVSSGTPETCPASPSDLPTGNCSASSTTMFSTLGVTLESEVLQAYDFAICAPSTTSTNAALSSMPTFQVTAIPKAGTVQAGQTWLYMNQFGLKMPASAW